MKKVFCPGCHTVYQIPDEKLKKDSIRAKCKKCGAIILIKANSQPIATPPPGPAGHPSHDEAQPLQPKYKESPVLQRRPQESGKDYLSISFFVAGIIALVFFGYMAINSFSKRDYQRPFKYLSEKITERLGAKPKGTGIRTKRRRRPDEEKYWRFINAGHRYFRQKKYDSAIKQYTMAIKVLPNRFEALYWRAQALARKGQKKEAIRDLKIVIRMNPKYVSAYDSLGWLYSGAKQWDEAIRYLTQAIKLNPKNGWAYYNRGRCYYKKGNMDKALEDAKKACNLGFKLGCKTYNKFRK